MKKKTKALYPYGDDKYEVITDIRELLERGWEVACSWGGDTPVVILSSDLPNNKVEEK